MFRKITLLFSFFCLYLVVDLSAQTFGNEWINYAQSYFKIPVTQTGIYRITQAQIAQAGISGVNPQHFQLFHRGIEQAIEVSGEADGMLDNTDYIEFYGQQNDGTQDRQMYEDPANHLNPYYSLFSDTTAYFLTWAIDGTPGKRIANVNQTIAAPFQPYLWKEEVNVLSENFCIGQNYFEGTSNELYLSQYDRGEGWASGIIDLNATRNFTLPTQNVYTPPTGQTVLPQIRIMLVGARGDGLGGNRNNTVEIRVGNATGTLRLLASKDIYLFTGVLFQQNIQQTDISGTGNLVVQIKTTKGRARVAYIQLIYPQTPTMDGTNSRFLDIPASVNNVTSLEINNPPANAQVYDITDANTLRKISRAITNGKLTCAVNNTTTARKLYIQNGTTLTPPNIQPITFANITPSNHDYLIVTHPVLRKSAGGFSDIVQAYADYRASIDGGSFQPLIMNIDVLYNQFSYGEKTPLAIRRYADWMYRNGQPKYLFLIGQAISFPDPKGGNLTTRKVPAHAALDLVPTWGFPPSDMAIVAAIGGFGGGAPVIPIGRIGAKNPAQILSYFNKVKEHEATPNALWQKNILHLTGGRTEAEQTLFRNTGDNWKQRAEGDFFGAQVSTVTKRTTTTVELVNVSEQVNAGLSLMTFLGHSALTITDLEIGLCSQDIQGYDNKGRYPLMLTNGCQLGAIFYNQTTLAEDWIFTPERGAIAFIGHSYFGYSNPLIKYTNDFYDRAFKNLNWIGKPIGDLLKEHARTGINFQVDYLTTFQQMILQGDPAIRFVKASLPDYEVTDNSLYVESFDGNPVTALADSFKLKIIISNLGLTRNQKIGVRVKRIYPDGSEDITALPDYFNPVRYRDTLTFVIRRNPAKNAFGTNVFEVLIDFEEKITEANENNNLAALNVFIPTVGVLPLLPKEFSIANEQPVSLTAIASNLLDEGRQFIFEVDTTGTFNSLAKRSAIVDAGLTGTWTTTLLTDNDQDSTVYYWRVNYADAITDPNALWGESSFVYIKNSPEGWSQSHFPQFRKDPLVNIKRDDIRRKWEFDAQKRRIKVQTFGSTNGSNYTTDAFMLFEEFAQVFDGNCNNDVIIAMAFSQANGFPYQVLPTQACGRDPRVANFYTNTQLLNGGLNSYLAAVPTGDFVLFFTIGNINFNSWTASLRSAFANVGGNPSIYNALQSGHPYIILGRKGGSISTATETIASSIANPTGDLIVMDSAIEIGYTTGQIFSTRIGPSEKWKQFIHSVRKETQDTYSIDLYGVDLQGNESVSPIISNITAPVVDLSGISATQYPYLQIKMTTTDAVNKTPAQLEKWLVLFDGVADGTMDLNVVGKSHYNVTRKEEGQDFTLEFAFRNLTPLTFDADSLTVVYSIYNQQTLKETITAKIKAPAPRDFIRFPFTVKTRGLGGRNQLKVEVNPKIIPEIYYENNVQIVDFEVNPDNANPLLEVAIDGKKIVNGEIVSPNPMISVYLRDENRFLQPQDPSNIFISLKRPCEGCQFQAVDITQSNVTWRYTNGILQVNLKEENLEEGIYSLQAQGLDVVGNKAGTEPYQINFEVVRESSVTNVFPYPNPFSTKTRFVFTLTGAEIPDEMKIQIMTISGKVVREITQAELGVIRVGNNLSEYAWDGTDEFGEKLANGVYLYRVIMRRNGQPIEHRKTSADKAFKNGIGKLYIAR
jgi:hypothetical protein